MRKAPNADASVGAQGRKLRRLVGEGRPPKNRTRVGARGSTASQRALPMPCEGVRNAPEPRYLPCCTLYYSLVNVLSTRPSPSVGEDSCGGAAGETAHRAQQARRINYVGITAFEGDIACGLTLRAYT